MLKFLLWCILCGAPRTLHRPSNREVYGFFIWKARCSQLLVQVSTPFCSPVLDEAHHYLRTMSEKLFLWCIEIIKPYLDFLLSSSINVEYSRRWECWRRRSRKQCKRRGGKAWVIVDIEVSDRSINNEEMAIA